MTSKTIPPEDESFKPVADYELKALLDHARLKDRPLSVRAILELQSRRSTQPDREAIIEALEDERQGYENLTYSSSDAARGNNAIKAVALRDAIERIRSLKHSDTTPDGGKNG